MATKTRFLASAAFATVAAFTAGSASAETANEARDVSEESPLIADKVIVTGQRATYAPPTASTGSREPVSILEIPHSISVITRQRIEDQNMAGIEDALSQVIGVTVSPWDTTTSQYRARGAILDLSYDGIAAFSTGGQPQFDLAMYDRVEVLRGPAALFRGSGNPSGSADLIRKRGRETAGISAAAQAGSWDNYRGELDFGGPLLESGQLRSRVVLAGQDRSYFHDRTGMNKWLGYGALDFDLTENTVLSVSAAYQDNVTDSPSMGLPAYTDGRFLDVSRSTHVYPDWNRYAYETDEYTVDLTHETSGGWVFRARAMTGAQDYAYQDAYPSTGVNPNTMTATYMRRAWDVWVGREALDAYVSGPVSLFGQTHHLTFGWGAQLYEWNQTGIATTQFPNVSIFNPNVIPQPALNYTSGSAGETKQTGAYAQARISVTEALKLILGGRVSDFENRSRTIPPGTATDWRTTTKETGEFSPYAGVVYYLRPNISAYASYTDIFIPQSAQQVTGETLDPRVGLQYEAGLKGRFFNDGLTAAIALFELREENRSLADTANPGFFLPAGEIEVRGWEFEIVGNPAANIDLSLGYSNLETEYTVHPTLVGQVTSPFEPEHTVKLYARYQFTSPGLERFFAAGGAQYSSGIIGTGVEGLREQGAFTVVNLQGGLQINRNTSLSLSVNNVLDETYWARVGGLNSYNTYGDPRSVMLALRAAF
ncbi:hypothetical protein BBF93_00090 [Hyphomonas sp. CACIAM 19H1]|uniref:TonB-dependent siderophore receptor n=1 Tax=Hyphomonas sp. CACIAM 19H1 TaxID=1873716 RepID=UPI000DED4A7B|nr:TonB-dependent siderophore receptor [Hyphomonas sp. CACIAM 19H1]AXE62786.1 hypothetical protein BBF93_00090 [Hyphomonas sp. CACIAM 19H1]